jgi:antitoxin component HigA of HigAB toxin-antitoxin module
LLEIGYSFLGVGDGEILFGFQIVKAVEFPPVRPVEILRYAIEDVGRTQAERAGLFDSGSRASEILSGKPALTVDMIWAISEMWVIPAELRIGEEETQMRRA